MRTKDPTISEMYAFDMFITTPGVRDGLLESAGTNRDVFIDKNDEGNEMVFYRTSWGESVPIGKPLQVAAGPAQTMTDAAEQMPASQDQLKELTPTVRQRLADFLQGGFEKMGANRSDARKRAQSLIGGPSSNLPLNIGLADIVPYLGTGLQFEESVHLAGEAVESAKAGSLGTAALQAGGAAIGLAPGAVPTIKATKAIKKRISKSGAQE